MNDQQISQEDEIDLREYIKIIIKRKKLVLSLFVIAIIIAAGVGFLAPKVYKATAMIMITPAVMQSESPSSKGPEGQSPAGFTPLVSMDALIETHVSLLKLNPVLEGIRQKLNSKNYSGMIAEDLLRKLNIKKAAGENVIQLEAIDTKPEEARDIANTWAEQYVEYTQELIKGEMKDPKDYFDSESDSIRKNLAKAENAVNNFKKAYKLDLMTAELKMKVELLNTYKNELDGMGLALKTKEVALLELKKQIATQKQFIIVSEAISDDVLLMASLQKEGHPGTDKRNIKSESINPIYQDLEMRIVNGEIELNTLKSRTGGLNESIESLTKETNDLDNDIIQKDFDFAQLTSQVDFLKKSCDTSNKIQKIRSIKAAQFGEVKIVSYAITPSSTEGRGQFKTVVLAGILSLIFGIFLAFFMEFLGKA